MTTHVLGISAFYHDSAACLVSDGAIAAAVQEERLSRIKGDASFPALSIQACLDAAGIDDAALDAVVFYERPLLKLDRLIETQLGIAPRGLRPFLAAAPLWLGSRLRTEQQIRRGLPGYVGPVLFAEHHESHASSAFFPSPFEQAAVLTVDGVGEWATATIGCGDGADLQILRELRFPDSLGLLYSAFTHHAGFEVNGGEYKLMGLAPYGQPLFVERILSEVMSLRDDGSFTLDQRFFEYLGGLTMTSPVFAARFDGERRLPESPVTQREMDYARSIQVVAEEVLLRMAREAHRLVGGERLCLAGGVALNAVANGRLVRESPFREIWIQPAAGDAGGAIGAAMLGWHRWLGNARVAAASDAMRGARLGPSWNSVQIERELRALGADFERVDTSLEDRVATLLDAGNIVGWFEGAMEFGPRALGARSILADPRDAAMQERLNSAVKRRESFRPFAPSVLQEHAADCFDLAVESPYMLLVAPVRDACLSAIPAAVHVDGTARVQTVDAVRSPGLHALLRAFQSRTGCPALVNTSFNVRDEPIVASPLDAYACFMGTEIDVLVMAPFLMLKSEQPRYSSCAPAPRSRLPAHGGRRFGLELGGVALIVGAWLFMKHEDAAVAGSLLALGFLLALVALLQPAALRRPASVWAGIATRISNVTSPLLLTVLYIGVLTPVALARRWRGSPILHENSVDSMWRLRTTLSKEEQREQMRHQS